MSDVSPPSGWTRLIELFHASDKIGFGFLVAGGFSLLGAYYEISPFTVLTALPGLHFFVVFFTLFGGATCTPASFPWLKRAKLRIALIFRRWHRHATLMSRVTNLIPFEQLCLAWIAHNKDANVFGSRFEDPFRSFLEHGFIRAAVKSGYPQGFQVDRRVFKNKGELKKLIPSGIQHTLKDKEPPWKRHKARI
jgi:hypothetical protein